MFYGISAGLRRVLQFEKRLALLDLEFGPGLIERAKERAKVSVCGVEECALQIIAEDRGRDVGI